MLEGLRSGNSDVDTESDPDPGTISAQTITQDDPAPRHARNCRLLSNTLRPAPFLHHWSVHTLTRRIDIMSGNTSLFSSKDHDIRQRPPSPAAAIDKFFAAQVAMQDSAVTSSAVVCTASLIAWSTLLLDSQFLLGNFCSMKICTSLTCSSRCKSKTFRSENPLFASF